MLEKILDFMGEHPVLTVVVLIVFFSGIAGLLNALR
jgi:hypothetical protein